MVKVKQDLTGMKFGRLTVLSQADDYIDKNGAHIACWLCSCDCGNPENTIVTGARLRYGHTKSCGCLKKDASRQNGYLTKKKNRYEFFDNYVVGYTTKNEPFYIDLEDYDKIKDICWHKHKQGYIHGHMDGRMISLHRLIMDFPDGLEVDHIGGELTRHDNRKSNLRLATDQENAANRKRPYVNLSGVVGVRLQGNSWIAQITYKGNLIYLGSFKEMNDAIKARKEAEKKYYQEFSYDNSQSLYKQSQEGVKT